MSERGEIWSCDKCDEPVVIGTDMVYTMVYDEENKITRHARCNPSMKQLQADVDERMARVRETLNGLRRRLR